MGVQGGSITTDIIKNGLIFNMDPANRASYPKTGTLVNDTVNNNTGSLESTSFTTSGNVGIFDLDGVDDYINFPHDSSMVITSTWTICGWVKLNTMSGGNGYIRLIGKQDIDDWCNYGIGFKNYYKPGVIANDGDWRTYYDGSTLNTGQWYNLTGIYNGSNYIMYIDGSLLFDQSVTLNMANASSNTSDDPIRIGSNEGAAEFLKGNLGPIHVYNRVLSASEVLHNYNALKGRFGL